MSGGALTGYNHDLYRLKEWAKRMEDENPTLAAHLRAMHTVLDRYDYYMSGDIGEEDIHQAWRDYCETIYKDLSLDEDALVERAKKTAEEYVRRTCKGYAGEKWWEELRWRTAITASIVVSTISMIIRRTPMITANFTGTGSGLRGIASITPTDTVRDVIIP